MQRPRRESVLTTVLFTDIVGSSQIVAEMGDRRWRVLLSRHHAMVRKELRRFGGRELDTAGDGFFARFDNPGNAIRCAASLVEAVQQLGIDIRAGLHLGQAEVVGKKLGGAAIHLGARTMGEAGPAEVMVTSVLKDVLPSMDFNFEDSGTHTLKGIPGEWRLFRLTSLDRPLPRPLERAVAVQRRATVHPPPMWRRPYVPVAIASVAAVALLVSGLLLFGRRDVVPPPSGLPAHALVRLDQRTGEVLATVPLENPYPVPSPGPGMACGITPPPRAIVAGEGSLWVTNGGSGSVLRFDARTGRRRIIRIPGRPVAIGTGRSGVWVASTGGDLTRIDPGTEETTSVDVSSTAPKPLGLAVDAQGTVYLSAFSCTFTSQEFPVVKVSGSGSSAIRLPLPPHGRVGDRFAVITVDGSLWITAAREVWKVEASTGKIVGRARFDQSLGSLAADEDGSSVWLTTVTSGGVVGWVYEIDAASVRILNQQPIGCCPGSVAVGQGFVWVTNSRDGTIQRISQVTGEVVPAIHVGRGVNAIAVGEGGVWVTIDRGT